MCPLRQPLPFPLVCPCLFYIYPPSTYFRFSELSPLKKSSFTFMNFWMKNRRAKRKKKNPFFCKLNLEYFYTVIYTMTKIFTSSWKNAGLGPKHKYLCQLPSNLSERNLFAVWEIDNFFSQSERTSGGLTWFVFVRFLTTPLPGSLANVLHECPLRGHQNKGIWRHSKFTEDTNWNKQKWCYCQSNNYNRTLYKTRIIEDV